MKYLQNSIVQRLDGKIVFMLGYFACVLIFFQANFTISRFVININVADVFAICGASIALFQSKYNKVNFRLPHIRAMFILLSIAFMLAFVVGLVKFGFTNYAFINRLLGFFILIGYAAIGAVFVNVFGMWGMRLLTGIMLSTVVVILCACLLINFIHLRQIIDPSLIYDPVLSGYANNRNAFAIQLLCLLCLLVPRIRMYNSWLVSFLITCIFLTYSRSAITTLLSLAAVLFVLNIINIKTVLKLTWQTAIILLLIFVLGDACWFCMQQVSAHLGYGAIRGGVGILDIKNLSPATSDPQRMYTIWEALRLWMDNPVLGIGLGGFVNHELTKSHTLLVIHNTFVWLLSEFGLLGLSVFVWYGAVLLKHFYGLVKQNLSKMWPVQDQILIGLIVIFALMGNAHEIFYQRIIWLVFGLCIGTARKANSSNSMDVQGAELIAETN